MAKFDLLISIMLSKLKPLKKQFATETHLPHFFLVTFIFPYYIVHWIFMCLLKQKTENPVLVNESIYH